MTNPLYHGQDQQARASGAQPSRPDEVGRGPFQKDYARLLHAASFRRLQGKTQLFPGRESEFFRNRLTHSLEVAQIGSGIASRLNVSSVPDAFGSAEARIDERLVEFAALAHDLGHPPFGHNGEKALDSLMREHGGFEGNAQTLRILTTVERKLVRDASGDTTDIFGLDLSFRALGSVLKYDKQIPAERVEGSKVFKGYYGSDGEIVRRVKKAIAPGWSGDEPFKTIECAIMDVADDIAYSTYDLEDCLHAGFVSPMSLTHAISRPGPVLDAVLAETDKALVRAGYETVKDGDELLQVLADVFAYGKVEVEPTKEALESDL